MLHAKYFHFDSLQLKDKMSTIKPFIFGGIASLTAEFGESCSSVAV